MPSQISLQRSTDPLHPDLLGAIVAATRQAVAAAERQRPLPALEQAAAGRSPRAELFRQRLFSDDSMQVIAECKRRSPLSGVLRGDYRPSVLAKTYQANGAAAVSVLTEPAFFDGALDHLIAVREAISIPVLRKDFIVTEYQLTEARAAGADAVLLIAAALDDNALRSLLAVARGLELAVLVEVHNEKELSRALESSATIIGVNNRNLRTMEVSLDVSLSLVTKIPRTVIAVAESGIRTCNDIVALRNSGYDAFLIGQSLITQADPGVALRDLLRASGSVRRGRR